MPAQVRIFQERKAMLGETVEPAMKSSDKHWADIIVHAKAVVSGHPLGADYNPRVTVDLKKVRGNLRVAVVSNGPVQVTGVLDEDEAND